MNRRMIDLRSDTVTRPTESMRAAMAAAEVGDDVYGEDPTVRALEEEVAALLGKEAALFTPTGSMANVLAVRSLVGVGQEVLCESSAHIARAELGAHGAFTGLTMRTWVGRPVELGQIESMFAPAMGPFFVSTRAISVENTHNFGGGTITPIDDLRAVRAFADDHEHARLLADACGVDPAAVHTNIVVVDVPDAPAVAAAAREHDVLVSAVGPRALRMVTHLDVTRAQAETAAAVLGKVLAEDRRPTR